jgi:hypothetical protein
MFVEKKWQGSREDEVARHWDGSGQQGTEEEEEGRGKRAVYSESSNLCILCSTHIIYSPNLQTSTSAILFLNGTRCCDVSFVAVHARRLGPLLKGLVLEWQTRCYHRTWPPHGGRLARDASPRPHAAPRSEGWRPRNRLRLPPSAHIITNSLIHTHAKGVYRVTRPPGGLNVMTSKEGVMQNALQQQWANSASARPHLNP